jgi:hypothetical protein
MTDDVTRGLSLLADEADAAPIDADAVIATATARSRQRAILASAFVTIFLVSALVLSFGAFKPDTPHTADGPTTGIGPPTFGTEVPKPASDAEQAVRRTRLQQQLTAAFSRILPNGWVHSQFDFACEPTHCWAEGEIRDDAGPLLMSVHVVGDYSLLSCYQPNCTKTVLADGTLVAFNKNDNKENNTTIGGQPERYWSISSVRHDGTSFSMSVRVPKSRTAPTLPDDQWRRFGTAITY